MREGKTVASPPVIRTSTEPFPSDRKWGAPEGYDLCINTTNLEIKKIIPGLKEMALCWFE